jgi:hypothetical protein
MTETKPKRRWFRFSLRTLFVVVTVICVAIGALPWREFSLVQHRKQFVSDLNQAGSNKGGSWDGHAYLSSLNSGDRTLSLWRRYCKDHCYPEIELPSKCSQDLIDKAVELFPEAQIWRWQSYGKPTNGNQAVMRVVIQEGK